MRRTTAAAPLVAAAIVPLLVGAAACDTPDAPRAAAPAAAPSGPYTVGVIDTDNQGRVFTDPNFLVLYHDDGDNPAAGRFACTVACLKLYHPLLVQPGATLRMPPGVLGTLGSVVRPDGFGDQVTVDGVAVYTFSGDQPGLTGGLTASWHAVPAPVRLPGPSGSG
ncbi:hypothetical protein [Streptacidiphilus jiangxiensis]|uniref:Lipoprotein n=1 Tax=Streptacidiphilus jiangxiensis TaxID=235985 RepID=A0A1H7Q2V5_STRJI|nr:hypothetical protein [Streptacidiphilus jiangxiensis]SEL42058.1 hypothetical protein SAMN05414137_108247 [Streptacidiphilus jiangxiensis]